MTHAAAGSMLEVGDPAPWFTARSSVNPKFAFDTVAGYYATLTFIPSAAHPAATRALQDLIRNAGRFGKALCAPFCVTIDPEDETGGRLANAPPGLVFFWDSDGGISGMYGAGSAGNYRPHTLILDPALSVIGAVPLGGDGAGHIEQVLAVLERQPAATARQAPVLVLPNVFEPELCRELIAYYDSRGGAESGYLRESGGMTVAGHDLRSKSRRDREIADGGLRHRVEDRFLSRVVPEIRKGFQFHATHTERHIVACYDAAEGGHFRAHRDNTTKGTAHRRFAASVLLNAGEYEGGLLRFPEFGPQLHTAPAGGAVIFSCSLLHEVTPVTKGRRYAYLPFLYDEAGAQLREQNAKFVQE